MTTDFELIAACIAAGLIPATIARGKGYPFFGWWHFGAALFMVALPWWLILKPDKLAIERRRIKQTLGI